MPALAYAIMTILLLSLLETVLVEQLFTTGPGCKGVEGFEGPTTGVGALHCSAATPIYLTWIFLYTECPPVVALSLKLLTVLA